MASVMWFRRDLRLADNPALAAAADLGPVLPLFVIDPALWDRSGAARRMFLIDSLERLSADLGGRLVIRHGDPTTVVTDVAEEVGAESVFIAEDFGPYGRRRDASVARVLSAAGRELQTIGSPYAVRPDSVHTGAGSPYRVFTPFFRAWRTVAVDGPIAVPARLDVIGDVRSDGIPAREAIEAVVPIGGEDAGHACLERFIDDAVAAYDVQRDLPAVEGTSRLSPHFKFGTIHPRQALALLDDSRGADVFRSELAWREFYADVLYHRPETARSNLNSKMDRMSIDSGPTADERFRLWATGQTGFPIVDAGMRQLAAEGWMHNRVRMITASFLVKDLHLDWRRGARHFMKLLVDGDVASNQHGWQWVAGTGTDASPYFRVFNPMTQSKRFDPSGEYIRRWVPELADVDTRSIHDPQPEGGGLFSAYPPPIVDHAVERVEALARYKALSEG